MLVEYLRLLILLVKGLEVKLVEVLCLGANTSPRLVIKLAALSLLAPLARHLWSSSSIGTLSAIVRQGGVIRVVGV